VPVKVIPGFAAHLFTTRHHFFKMACSGWGYDAQVVGETVFDILSSCIRGAIAVAVLAVGPAACQSSESPRGTGTVISTVGETVPLGLEPAYIVLIDGHKVFPKQRGFALAPGVHEIRVAPHVEGPTHQVPTHYAMIRELTNDALDLNVEAGWTYHVAMRVIKTPDYTNRLGHWQAVVARAIPPAETSGD
jgi:hypothetical protein